jgi:nitrous oxidase accessory protein NosD
MRLVDSGSNVIIRNQLRNNLLPGVEIYWAYRSSLSSSNIISNNTFVGNNGAGSTYNQSHIQAYDDGINNSWNSTDGYGNYWSDWTTPDANHDGIVDQPYTISGSAGAKDYHPLTTP